MTDFDVLASALRVDGRDVVPAPLMIEASAGSGKTWTLAHLAVRFMVEDAVEPAEVLLVTFTRDAARELRGRVREHLDEVIEFLSGAGPAPGDDDWRAAWARRVAEPAAREFDLRRARHCRANLDGLNARTIHSFAAVNTVGPAKGLGHDGRLWRQALAEARARWSLRRPHDAALVRRHGDPTTLDAVAWALYEAGVRRGDAGVAVDVVPRLGESDADERTRAALCQRELALDVVHRFCALMGQARRTSFADLVVGLAERLGRDDAARFIAELRSTFRVVMIDEFQDTDPLQWHVFRELFLTDGCRLVVVGDPKQAIYRFRSATVETFIEVRDDCRARGVPVATLSSNYRSTPAMVNAINEIFAGTDFHYGLDAVADPPAIGYEPARSRREDLARDVTSFAGTDASVHLRVAPYRRGAQDPTYEEMAAYVARARASGVPYREVAILAASNEDCRRIHRFLSRRRIPSTTASDVSIFDCAAARQLRHLLAALAAPEDATLTEALRATWFRGPGAEDPSDHGVGRLVTRLAGAFDVVGVGALTRYLRGEEVQRTVGALRDAERHLTDLAHLSELITRECAGVTFPALVLAWLDEATAGQDADENATTRRLEDESDAVRVLTIHKAKGLEFDVVLLPDLVRGYRGVDARGRGALRRWVDAGRTVVDAGSGIAWGTPEEARERAARTEAAVAGEQRRLLYVALTRARRAAVAWVRLRANTPLSGELARLLLDREDAVGSSRVRNRSLAELRSTFVGGSWSAKDDPAFRAARTDPVTAVRGHFARSRDVAVFAIGDEVPALAPPAPASATERQVVAARAPFFAPQRRRWSYSDVARELKESRDGADDLDDVGGADEAEPSVDERALEESAVRADVAATFGDLAGKRLGLVVHRVLERAVGAGGALESLLDEALAEHGVGADEVGAARPAIAASLRRALERPLVTLQGRALGEVAASDVATEMRFVLALGDAAVPTRLSAAAAAVREHDRSGADGRGLFAQYFASPDAFAHRLSEGYLVGSLDLTVRASDGAYRVVDYKTDQVPGRERPYAAPALAAHMADQHYPLQALFYAVALHRFLRSRLAGYDPARHLGGVDYYFVRVVGDASAQPDDGVLSWPLSPEAVVAASDALAGGRG